MIGHDHQWSRGAELDAGEVSQVKGIEGASVKSDMVGLFELGAGMVKLLELGMAGGKERPKVAQAFTEQGPEGFW